MRAGVLAGLIAAAAAQAQLPSWYSTAFPTNTSGWTINGTQPLSPYHLTDSTWEGVALLRCGSPSPDYEVNAKLAIGATGGSAVVYLRASADARLRVGGTFYAVEFANITAQRRLQHECEPVEGPERIPPARVRVSVRLL